MRGPIWLQDSTADCDAPDGTEAPGDDPEWVDTYIRERPNLEERSWCWMPRLDGAPVDLG